MPSPSPVPASRALDPSRPFVELDEAEPRALLTELEGGWRLEIPLEGVEVEQVAVEVAPPLLYVRRLDEPERERRFALLSQVDVSSLRAELAGGRLVIEARRAWSPPHRLPVRCEFLWEGRVAHRPGEPLPPRPTSPDRR